MFPFSTKHHYEICYANNQKFKSIKISKNSYYFKLISLTIKRTSSNTVLFILGYKWNFIATANYPDSHRLSGYVLMSIFSGYQFVNAIVPFKMVSGSGTSWLIYYVVKFVLYVVSGFFTAPFTIGWNIFKLIRSIVK